MTEHIPIPPESVAAAARAIGEETYVGNKQTLRDAATAAIRAALAAWPGMNHDSQAWRGYGGEVLILPLNTEPRDE